MELDRRQNGAPPRSIDRPSPTVTSAAGKGVWVLRTGANTMKHNRRSEDVEAYEREADSPAPTVDGKAGGAWRRRWCFDRPSTAVMGDPRIAPPGYRGGHDNRSETMMANAVRVELHELAALQDFPEDWPFQGNRSQVAKQIGNAVPPTLAEVIVRVLAA